jgi:hypothetical protein
MNASNRCPQLLKVNHDASRLCKYSHVTNMGVVGAKLLLCHAFMLVTSGCDLALIPYETLGFLPLDIFTTPDHRILDALFEKISKKWALVYFPKHAPHMTSRCDPGLHL